MIGAAVPSSVGMVRKVENVLCCKNQEMVAKSVDS